MNLPVPTNADEAVRRARSVLKSGHYDLGAGGRVPQWKSPWDVNDPLKRIDCSGFVAWCLGIDRYQPLTNNGMVGDWIETTAIFEDATHRGKMFSAQPRNGAMPGDLYVYGDHATMRNKFEGHVGLISEVDTGLITKVIHASHGNQVKFGSAINETPPDVFLARGIVARYLRFSAQ